MQYVNDSNFEAEVLKADLPVLVDFFAEWCGLNVEEAPATSEKYNVMSIPTFIVFKNGTAVKQHVGELSKEGMTSLIGL